MTTGPSVPVSFPRPSRRLPAGRRESQAQPCCRGSRPGFTLFELLIVLGILGILASVVLLLLRPTRLLLWTRDTGRRLDAVELGNAVMQYVIDRKTLPPYVPQPLPTNSGSAVPVCKPNVRTDPDCADLHALRPAYLSDLPIDSHEPCRNFTGYGLYAAATGFGVVPRHLGEPPAVCAQRSESAPRPVATVAAAGSANSVSVYGDLAFVLNGVGAAVFDVSDPVNPVFLAQTSCGTDPGWKAPVFVGSILYVPCGYGGLKVYNMSNPGNPQLITTTATSFYVLGVVVEGSRLYVLGHYTGVGIYDISTPANPVYISTFSAGDFALDGQVAGTTFYAAAFRAGLRVFDVSNGAAPLLLGTGPNPPGGSFYSHGVTVDRGYAYVSDVYRIIVYDVSDPRSPVVVSVIPADAAGAANRPLRSFLAGRYLHVTGVVGGIYTFDVSDPASPVRVGYHETGSSGAYRGVAVRGDYAYVADVQGGLVVYDLFGE